MITPGKWETSTLCNSKRPEWMVCREGGGDIIADLSHIRNNAEAEANARAIAEVPNLIESVKGLARIVEAFGYTTQLGKNQRERLENAQALIKRIEG